MGAAVSEPTKLSVVQGERNTQRMQDMRDVLKEAAACVEDGELERLMVVLVPYDRSPEMFMANCDVIPTLGVLSYISQLVLAGQMHELPDELDEPAEDAPDDDAPPEE